MMNLVKVISTQYDSFQKRMIKVLRFGKSDVQTPHEAAPYGVDSNPIKDMVAVFSETLEKGKPVIVGYLNKNQLAEPGEIRHFSTDSNGNLKFYTWLKSDGTMEIGGNVDNMVRHAKLDLALQQQVNLINTELAKISAAVAVAGGSYVVAPISLDISPAKIDEVKTL